MNIVRGSIVAMTAMLASMIGNPASAIDPAVSLFDVQLSSASIEDLSGAVKKAGGNELTDLRRSYRRVFDSHMLLDDSTTLTLLALSNGRMVSAEYELPITSGNFLDLERTDKLARLIATRYGPPDEGDLQKPQTGPGPRHFSWSRNGVKIEVESPWPPVAVRLRYTVEVHRVAYQAERKAAREAQLKKKADRQRGAF